MPLHKTLNTIDISNIDEENYQYAIHLAITDKIIVYDKIFKIAPIKNHNKFKSVDFWRNISLSVEILLKACMLKHHFNFFHKRANAEYGPKVTAINNKWLENTLKELDISYIAQINTGTISTTLKHAEKEFLEQINPEKSKLIQEIIYIIVRTRRNRNTHFFFPNQAKIDINEVEMIYLPILNLLEEIYESNL